MDNYYFIVSKAGMGISYGIDIIGNNPQPGTLLQVFPVKQTPNPDNQLWEMIPDPENEKYFFLQSKLPGNPAIAVKGKPSETEGTPLEIVANNPKTDNMRWRFIEPSHPSNFFTIESKLGKGLVMDIKGGTPEETGTALQVFPKHGEPHNERWTLTPAVGNSYSPTVDFVFNPINSDVLIKGSGFMPLREVGIIYNFNDPNGQDGGGLFVAGGDGGGAPILASGSIDGTFDSPGLTVDEQAINPGSTISIQVADGLNLVNVNGMYNSKDFVWVKV
jgi:hypothetical protein